MIGVDQKIHMCLIYSQIVPPAVLCPNRGLWVPHWQCISPRHKPFHNPDKRNTKIAEELLIDLEIGLISLSLLQSICLIFSLSVFDAMFIAVYISSLHAQMKG